MSSAFDWDYETHDDFGARCSFVHRFGWHLVDLRFGPNLNCCVNFVYARICRDLRLDPETAAHEYAGEATA